jgi:uncharacterized protein YjbI with pentapeptide repeats
MDISLDKLNPITEQTDSSDPLFDPVSKQLLRAIANLAQQSSYPDLLTCWVILDLERLGDRLRGAGIEELFLVTDCSKHTFDGIKSKAIEKLGQLLPLRVEGAELDHRRPELERWLPMPNNNSENLTELEHQTEAEFPSENIIEFGSAEAAQEAASILQGRYLGERRIFVPDRNINPDTLDCVAGSLGSTWQSVDNALEVDSAENRDEEAVGALNRLALIETMLASISEQLQEQLNQRSSDSSLHVHLPYNHEPPETPQELVERKLESGFHSFTNETLTAIDLSNRTLKDISFDRSDLRNANFENSRLINCSFTQSNLMGANFKNVQAPGIEMSSACLSQMNFEGANLCAAQFDWVNLRDAILCNANFTSAILEGSNLSDSDCSDANFTGAKLHNTRCISSCFLRANLTHTTYEFAKLTAANFDEAKMDFASFAYSNGFDPKRYKKVRYYGTHINTCMTKTDWKQLKSWDWQKGLNYAGIVLGMMFFSSFGTYLFIKFTPNTSDDLFHDPAQLEQKLRKIPSIPPVPKSL